MTTPPAPRQPAETQPIVLRPSKTRQKTAEPRPPAKPSPKPQGGFTLLEIMLVVMIIALLGGAAIYYMGGNINVAQKTRTQTDLQAISTQLKLYQALNGFLPTTEQGLSALISQPASDPKPKQWQQFFEKMPVDPWQSDYNYVAPGKHNVNTFDVFSSGADRKPGTADDMGNWE